MSVVVSEERAASLSVGTGFSCKREEFSLPDGVHFLNCAYMSPLSRRVERVGIESVQRKRNPVDVPPDKYFTVPQRVRSAFARLVNGGDGSRVALVPSVSYAMAIAVKHLPMKAGENVIVIGEEFPSAVLPWRKAAKESGAELRTVSAPNCDRGRGVLWNERVYEAIDPATVAVVMPNVHWSDGTRFDLEAIAARARMVGAMVIVDGTQSVGALPFDVEKIQPDLLVTAGYKWLMGGYGLSVAYFGPRFDTAEPIEEVWTSQIGSEDFTQLARYRDAYRSDASRFDGGERAHFILAEMLAAAIEQLLEWGVENIQSYCDQLTRPWLERLVEGGVWVEDPRWRSAHLFGIRSRQLEDPKYVAEVLQAHNVHVSVRGDAIRVSPNVYNTEEDLASLVQALVASRFCNPL
jgi:selenocysteine lyase/cysteine desulfurase